ncbi:MAG: NAD(P)H-dependent oxidoreductase subunit E, partial [Gammaproteobacteria bacterium]
MPEHREEHYIMPEAVKAEIDRWLSHYPEDQKSSAVLAALHAVQRQDGWVSRAQMDAVAAYLDMPRV